jgi:hypothetical protein
MSVQGQAILTSYLNLKLAEPNMEIIPLPEGTLDEEIKFQIKLNGTGCT